MANPTFQDNASELQVLLKTVYGPGIEEQQNLTPMAYKRFKRATVTFGGNAYEFPCRMGSPQSIGMRGYRSPLPNPKATLDVTGRVRHKFFYATGDITGPDLAKGKGNVNAFVNVFSDKMDALTRIALKDLNFQFYLAGDGIYAKITNIAGNNVSVDTIKYLRVNRRTDIWDDSATALLEAAATNNRAIGTLTIAAGVPTLTFKNDVTGAVIAPPGTAAAPDGIVPETGLAATATTVGMFMNGLKAIVDDGTTATTFQDISRTTYPLWKAKVLSNGGTQRPLTLPLMQIADDIPEVMTGERVNLIIGSPNARNLYTQLLVAQKRFVNTGNLDGGYEVLDFNGKTFLIDVDCQDDRIYFLNSDYIQHYGLMDLKFDDSDGAILKHSLLTGGDVYYFFMKTYANFGSNRCNAHSVITDLEVDQNYLIAA